MNHIAGRNRLRPRRKPGGELGTRAGYHDEVDRECSWPHLLKEPGIDLFLPGLAVEHDEHEAAIDALNRAEPKANVPDAITDEEGLA